MTTTVTNDDAVYVCPERNIECGRNPASWCATCPQRATRPREQADERALFEAYARKELNIPDHVEVKGRSEWLLGAWNVWQARAALTRQAAPSPCVTELVDERIAHAEFRAKLRKFGDWFAQRNVEATGPWRTASEDAQQEIEGLLTGALAPQQAAPEAPALPNAEAIQWRNIQKVLRDVAAFCFGSGNRLESVSLGAAYAAVVNSLTAKDGLTVKLEPLLASTGAAPEAPTACSHVWNDFGQLGGRNVSWCPRCDTLAWTGKELGAAPEAPALTAAMQALRDLLLDVKAGVMDGDAVRDAQALIDKYDDPEPASEQQALSDEEAYAQSSYRHFMSLEKFKDFRAGVIPAATTASTVTSPIPEKYVKSAETRMGSTFGNDVKSEDTTASDPDGEFALGMLAELHRMGASPAGLALAAQLFGVGPCPACGFRKLHCRCPDNATTASAKPDYGNICRDCCGPVGEDHSDMCGVASGPVLPDHCGDSYKEATTASESDEPPPRASRHGKAKLVELLKAIRPKHGDVGTRDVDVTAQQKRIDRAIELLGRATAPSRDAAALTDDWIEERVNAEFARRTHTSSHDVIRAVVRAALAQQGAAQAPVAWRRATKHGWEYRNTAPTASTRGEGWLPLADAQAAHAGADTEFAIKFIEQRAGDYIRENASSEHDTGATVWHYGDAGRDYHSTLVELADDIRAAMSATTEKEPKNG